MSILSHHSISHRKTLNSSSCKSDKNERLRSFIDLHLHPKHGSLYWLKREKQLDINIRDSVRTFEDLPLLGITEPGDLANRSAWDFLPQALWKAKQNCIIGESGGTTGCPSVAIYTQKDFHSAFIEPFISAANVTGFPQGTEWLWIGPSGPHIIGKVVRELAKAIGSPDPWSVDFDPRWVKKLVPGSIALKRYLSHVVDQAIQILDRESPEVLFTTPPILNELSKRLSEEERSIFKGVHYGGLQITADEINQFKKLYPNAVHLSGYGNSLCGVALELEDTERNHVDYFPYGNRLIYDVVRINQENNRWKSVQPGETGRVLFHRIEESTFLPNVLERDEATLIAPNSTMKTNGWTLKGLRDPGPPDDQKTKLKTGIY